MISHSDLKGWPSPGRGQEREVRTERWLCLYGLGERGFPRKAQKAGRLSSFPILGHRLALWSPFTS